MDSPTPTPDQKDASALNAALVEELKRRGWIRTPRVEAAFRAVPRHLFVPGVPLDDVYRDQPIPTKRSASGEFVSSSSQPAIMAIMLEQLGLAPGHRVLEIGAGTGYNAALMAHIVGDTGQVVTVDIDEDLVAGAREHLLAAGCDAVVRVVCGDGGFGHPDVALYDRIILTVGAWDIVPAWREQLKPDGRLVLPLSIEGSQLCVAFEPRSDHLESVSVEDGGFMMLRGAFAGPGGLVQLGPEPGLSIRVNDRDLVDAEAIYGLLTGPSRDRPTGVRVRSGEVFGSLSLWLAHRERGYCSLHAFGGMVDRGIIPDLFRFPGSPRSASTMGLLGDAAVCVLMRPPDQVPSTGQASAAGPFELFIRSFGPDDALAHRLTEHIKAWDAAGRPSSKGLRIRAYPKAADFLPSADELVIEKRWTRLVLGRGATER